MRRRYIVLQAVLVAVAVLACTSSLDRRVAASVVEQAEEHPFYTLEEPRAPGVPGELVRVEPIESVGDGQRAWRMLYHSTDLNGADVVVSGVVVAPDGPALAARPIVSWAHPTTGAAVNCAPSLAVDPFVLIEGLDDLVSAGYVVVATDYPGMGLPGEPSYLIGRTEGNSVLDAARAARSIDGTHAGDELVLWGHSQGGQAALFAAEDAASYAPELRLQAVAVAAPAADLGALLEDNLQAIPGVTIGSFAFTAYQEVYAERFPGLALDSILTPAGVAATPALAKLCLVSGHQELQTVAHGLAGRYVKNDPASTEPWATMLRENTPGTVRIPVPLLVAQGEVDTLVHPSATAAFVRTECALGTETQYRTIPKTGHGMVALRALPAVLEWFHAALADDRAPSVGTPC
ncbi:alpha/beta fold hydrolase [Plantibacter flavus]|uniref:alpha/beta fold hydrolase n=1 Tax=Plantibacter flavus TaxID=150123 RepID=UPI003F5CCE4C